MSAWAAPAAVIVALAFGAVRLLGHLLTETGWAVPGAPGHLFVVASGAAVAPGRPGAGAPFRGAGHGQLGAAAYRTVTRPPLDYSGTLVVPTPFGDLPLDLWRQLFRGPLLLAVLIAVTAASVAR